MLRLLMISLLLVAATPDSSHETIENLLARAKQGDANAHFELSRRYVTGDGVLQDLEAGVKWLRGAAERGHPEAQVCLAVLGIEKLDIPIELKRGIIESLGGGRNRFRKLGKWVSREESLKWLRIAAEDGHVFVQLLVGFASEGEEAREWFHKAGAQMDEDMKTSFGAMLVTVEGKLDEGLRLVREAAEQGHAEAQFFLAQIYRGQKHEEARDLPEARKWLHMAAEQGLLLAQLDLGFAYLQGKWLPQNFRLAESWFRQAAQQGSTMAKHTLGMMYESGQTFVGKIDAAAYFWYILAAADGDSDAREARDGLAQRLTKTQRFLQQESAREWIEEHDK